ncbi:coiled-coil domain-containing protein 112 [Hippoglossus stenolepis]|uniref:coiled-coil domain-containing protein 112 n=1 Tax=Hippoglossus stenolepis TaxID=195615 RepID=UPI001FB047C0|nr:coiled-coil domain-containing protein 112 [Hippoglossus stenolepis]
MASMATARRADKHLRGDTRGSSSVPLPCTATPLSSDGVDHRQKAAQFLREAEKNRRQIEKLEKESVQCRKNGWTDVCGDLKEYEKVLEDERCADKMNLQKQLVKIQNGVKKFQRQLIDVKPTPELIERLNEIMSEVEISINALKEERRSCLEELLKEERTCRQEIAAYEKKIENWSLSFKSEPKLPTTPSVKKIKPPDSDLPAEVRALESFLQKTGGPYGGWDQYDHQAFLKVWTKQRGHPAYRKEAKLYLPGKTLEEIEHHEVWHQQLIKLQDRKREAIQRWKASKHRELQSRIQSQEEAEEAERGEKEAKSQQHRTEEEKWEAARRLEEWREKKRWKEEQEEEQRLAEEIQKRRREKEERRRQLEVKLTVEEQLRLRREEEEEQGRRRREEEQREMDERRREAAKGIKRFNERDLHKLEEKLQEKQLREKEEEERQRRITVKLKEKVDCHVSRDPSRLTRPTKGWEERMKHVGSSGEGPVLHMSHRAVPTWRQDL